MINIKQDTRESSWQVGDTFESGGEIYLIGKGRDSLYRVVSTSGFISLGYDTIEDVVENWVTTGDAKVDLDCTIK